MFEKPTSYRAKVYEFLKEEIIRGEIKQGEALNERKLAEQLGISRTPIREALQMLATDGWVLYEPYRETVVRTFDLNFISDAQKVRRALEILAVEEAVEHLTEDEKKRLQSIYSQQSKVIENYDPVEFINFDRQFHELLYNASHNAILQDLLSNLSDIIRYFGIKVLLVPERSEETLKEHRKVLEAILAGNVEEATEAMKYHLTKTGEALVSMTEHE